VSAVVQIAATEVLWGLVLFTYHDLEFSPKTPSLPCFRRGSTWNLGLLLRERAATRLLIASRTPVLLLQTWFRLDYRLQTEHSQVRWRVSCSSTGCGLLPWKGRYKSRDNIPERCRAEFHASL